MDSCYEEDKPPPLQDSKGISSSIRHSGVDFSDLYRIPIWRGGNLAGLAIHGDISRSSLWKHQIVDLGS